MHTILIVEDDAAQRQMVSEELAREGFLVLTAGDGQEALDRIERSRIDVVVMDIRLPRVDGMQVLARLLTRQEEVPVILHTAYSTYKEHILAWAAKAYVLKRSDLTELKEAIQRVLEKEMEETTAIGAG